MILPFRDDVPSQRTPVVMYLVIVLNFVSLLWTLQLGPVNHQLVSVYYGFIPARLGQLTDPRPVVVDIQGLAQLPHLRAPVAVRQPVQLAPDRIEILATLLTSLFLHAGWLHFLGNMWFLWIFGDNVEDRLGHVAFACLYLGGGVVASLCHAWMTSDPLVPVIGASGAVAAVLGAYAITWPMARVHSIVVLVIFVTIFELPALVVLGFWFLTQLLEARNALNQGVDGGVAWWAHVGGFVFGAVCMKAYSLGAPPPTPHGDHFKEAWMERHGRRPRPLEDWDAEEA
jgi:rhomboid family protein